MPRVAFEHIAREILGQRYDLSLVICGDTLARRINIESRKKTYKPNVLSFPIDQHEGEIFLNIRKAQREAKQLGITARERIAFLFIHGCLHLAGMDHQDDVDAHAMETREAALLGIFGFKQA